MTTFLQPPFWAGEGNRGAIDRGVPNHVAIKYADGPVDEPLSVEDAKLYLRVSVPDEDGLIASLITAARVFCERRTGRAIAARACEVLYDRVSLGQWLILPVAPVTAVVQIATTDLAGTSMVVDPVAYLVDLASEPPRIGLPTGQWWPMGLRAFQAVAVQLTVGYPVAPADIVHAIRLLVGHFYENRVASQPGARNDAVLPLGVAELLAPYDLVMVP